MVFDERTRALIALGASVAVNCQPCVKLHINEAKENNIGDREIKEAIIIGRNVKTGAAAKFDDFIATLNEGTYLGPSNTDECISK